MEHEDLGANLAKGMIVPLCCGRLAVLSVSVTSAIEAGSEYRQLISFLSSLSCGTERAKRRYQVSVRIIRARRKSRGGLDDSHDIFAQLREIAY